ncbi:alpha/beta hydrolase [Marinobacter sp. BGYM27]|uniref:alpha/beta fold hydrolase n=1 Tax=Marinobacter sp. BGYM27 TaxID=2975597 RepID=UPI0021A2AE69|nr:alpha/beta hydrolase [Marinobacter sp. BGYM27]MDG5501453.1 alpha/beta hydrolase [Marinobacter sp. BGYM27]
MHWILLRGLTREHAHWGHLPEHLRLAFPEERFHCVDLPGTGTRFRETSPWTIRQIRRAVQRQVAHIPGPYGLIALSMGGMVAMDWAQDAPEGEIQRLILINTSSGFNPPWHRMRPVVWPTLLHLLLLRDIREREAQVLALTSNRQVNPGTVQGWYSIQKQRPVSPANAFRQLSAAARFRPASSRPLPDALLLASKGDRIVDWRCSATLEKRWQWPLRLHPDAGHDLPLDDPEWVVQQLQTYLSDA